MNRDEEARLAAESERDADDPDAWEEAPAPSPYQRRRLGTQVTIRLDPASAERLRRLARHYDTNYTSMLRAWIEQRLVAETATLSRHGRHPVEVDAQPAGQGGWPQIQVSGAGRLHPPQP